MISVQINEQAALRAIGAVFKQVTFAAANALNDTVFEARDAVRTDVQGNFIVRRPWVLQGIQVPSGGKATRDKLEAELVLDPTREFLAKFEKGGTKSPRAGGSLAIPEAARPTPQSLIPARLRPRRLQIADAAAQTISFKRKGGIGRGRIRQKNQGLFRTFLVEGVGIFQRTGRGAGSTTRLLYGFEPRAQIPADLHFERTAREVAARSYQRHFNTRFLEALRTAR
jgi:hypothetical protein